MQCNPLMGGCHIEARTEAHTYKQAERLGFQRGREKERRGWVKRGRTESQATIFLFFAALLLVHTTDFPGVTGGGK